AAAPAAGAAGHPAGAAARGPGRTGPHQGPRARLRLPAGAADTPAGRPADARAGPRLRLPAAAPRRRLRLPGPAARTVRAPDPAGRLRPARPLRPAAAAAVRAARLRLPARHRADAAAGPAAGRRPQVQPAGEIGRA